MHKSINIEGVFKMININFSLRPAPHVGHTQNSKNLSKDESQQLAHVSHDTFYWDKFQDLPNPIFGQLT